MQCKYLIFRRTVTSTGRSLGICARARSSIPPCSGGMYGDDKNGVFEEEDDGDTAVDISNENGNRSLLFLFPIVPVAENGIWR